MVTALGIDEPCNNGTMIIGKISGTRVLDNIVNFVAAIGMAFQC